MLTVAAFCTKCGFTFPFTLPFNIQIGKSKNIQFTNNSTNCPRCGGMANISDLVIDDSGNAFIQNMYSVLARPGITSADLQKVLEISKRGEAQNSSISQIAEDIKRNVPAARPVAEYLQLGNNIAGILAVFISIISLIIQMRGQNESASASFGQPDEQRSERSLLNKQRVGPPVSIKKAKHRIKKGAKGSKPVAKKRKGKPKPKTQ